jgi:DNA-binding MarR family transcriptional regulator
MRPPTYYSDLIMNHRLVYLLNVGQRQLHRWTQARAVAGGVTAVQAGLLFFLAKNDGALMSEAAAALNLGASGITGLADRMEKLELIARKPDAKDLRISRLWLTAEGEAAFKRTKAGLSELNAILTEGFTPAEIDVVARWLDSLPRKFPDSSERSELI